VRPVRHGPKIANGMAAVFATPQRCTCRVRRSGRCQSTVGPVSGTFLTSYRYRLKDMLPTPNGAPSVGAMARKGSSRLVRRCPGAVADGPPQRIRDTGKTTLPGDEAWLIVEQQDVGKKKYYSPTCGEERPAKPGSHHKARWICNRAPSRWKEELGLTIRGGRS